MASPTHLQYPQNEQPSLASWSAPSSASSYLNHTSAPARGSDNHGPPPEVLPRLDAAGSMHGSGSHLLPAGLMEQSNVELTSSAATGTATGTNLPNENGASHYSHPSNGTPNGSSTDLLTQLAQAKSEAASLQKKLRQSESQVEYLTKCCTEAGTELAKSHHEHTQTRKKLQELGVQEKKSAIMGENARNSLRNVMAENVELREEVVRLRELLARNGMSAGGPPGGIGVEGAHLGGGGGSAGSAHGNGIMHGNPLYSTHGGSTVDQHQHHHQHIQHHNPSVGGITSGLSGMTFASAGASTSSSQNNSTTPPPGTVPASSTASGTASASSSLASPHEAYQLTSSYPSQSGSGSGYPGKDLDAMNGVLAPSNHLPPLAYSGSLGVTSAGNEPSPYDMAEYNTAGLPSEAAARALEREAGPGRWGGGRGDRGRRSSGGGGRGRGAGRGGGGGGGYRGRRS